MNIPLPTAVFPAKQIIATPVVHDVSEREASELEYDALSQAQRDARKIEDARKPSAPKPPFVRKPHLTDRALAHHPGLQALKDSLETNKSQTPKPKTGSRRQSVSSSK